MVIFNSYVKLPEGSVTFWSWIYHASPPLLPKVQNCFGFHPLEPKHAADAGGADVWCLVMTRDGEMLGNWCWVREMLSRCWAITVLYIFYICNNQGSGRKHQKTIYFFMEILWFQGLFVFPVVAGKGCEGLQLQYQMSTAKHRCSVLGFFVAVWWFYRVGTITCSSQEARVNLIVHMSFNSRISPHIT